jgi:hypothetical protein
MSRRDAGGDFLLPSMPTNAIIITLVLSIPHPLPLRKNGDAALPATPCSIHVIDFIIY